MTAGARAPREPLSEPPMIAKSHACRVATRLHTGRLEGGACHDCVEHKVGALPVVRPDTRELVGILSYIDVLRAYQGSLADAC